MSDVDVTVFYNEHRVAAMERALKGTGTRLENSFLRQSESRLKLTSHRSSPKSTLVSRRLGDSLSYIFTTPMAISISPRSW